MAGSHVLERFLNDVARDITDPETGLSVWKRKQLSTIRSGSPEARKEARSRADLRIGALGSGSDFTPFLQHLGVASLNLGYGGEDDGGIYHSIYDDFYWFTHFSDTSVVYGRALAQTVGTAVMRLADAELLPFEFGNLAETVHTYVQEIQKLLDNEREKNAELQRELDEGTYAATNDLRAPTVAPKLDSIPPHLNFAPLENAADALGRAAERYEKAVTRAQARGDTVLASQSMLRVNEVLLRSERALTDPKGLPGRPWFVHALYAPGFYTGYGVKTMPAIREAIEQQKYGDVDAGTASVAAALRAEAALINQAATTLEGAH
jgi:N-acetylated-alpha-linked acidic dipeptidase